MSLPFVNLALLKMRTEGINLWGWLLEQKKDNN